VLVHCLAGRQTHLQQCCRSLAAIPAAVMLMLLVDFNARFNENKVGIVEF